MKKYLPTFNSLAVFTSTLILFFVCLEIFVRKNENVFEGASHRLLAKTANYQNKPHISYVFFGTSRTQDGVAPRLVSRHMQQLKPELQPQIGFNSATMGGSLDDLFQLLPRYLENPELRTVLIEISTPHLGNKPSLPAANVGDYKSFEERISYELQKFAIIKYRLAFRPGTFGTVISLLLFSPIMSGSEVRLTDFIAAWSGKIEPDPQDFHAEIWTPSPIIPNAADISFNQELENQLIKLKDISSKLKNNGIKVIFYVPPASSAPLPERDQLIPFYRELVYRTQADLWDFSSCAIPDKYFKDPTHLNKDEGKSSWSFAIAELLAKIQETK